MTGRQKWFYAIFVMGLVVAAMVASSMYEPRTSFSVAVKMALAQVAGIALWMALGLHKKTEGERERRSNET